MDIFEYAISIEVNINDVNIAGDSALICAIKIKNLDMVKKVISNLTKLVEAGAKGI
jgi:ankyrin repeat protein